MLVLKAVSIHAKHVLYIRTVVRALQAGTKNTNPLIKNLSRLLRENLGSFMWASAEVVLTIHCKSKRVSSKSMSDEQTIVPIIPSLC